MDHSAKCELFNLRGEPFVLLNKGLYILDFHNIKVRKSATYASLWHFFFKES